MCYYWKFQAQTSNDKHDHENKIVFNKNNSKNDNEIELKQESKDSELLIRIKVQPKLLHHEIQSV